MIAVFAIILAFSAAPGAAQCADNLVQLKGDWGQARFTVELADEPDERAQGLMNREKLATSHGMLFLYASPRRVSFWMKNTLIPLDMIFMDEAGRVTRIHENARPLDETPIDGGAGVRAVLEINGGLSRRIGITEGSLLRHPALGEAAAWPCGAP
ncbi:MAG: DUF192 domain-containing protein [Paracoccaceae bacterium]